MNNTLSNSNDVLEQRIGEAENLLQEDKDQHKKPDITPQPERKTRGKIYNVLKGLLPEVECRNGTLSPEKAEHIASLVTQITKRDRHGNEYLRDYLVRLMIT